MDGLTADFTAGDDKLVHPELAPTVEEHSTDGVLYTVGVKLQQTVPHVHTAVVGPPIAVRRGHSIEGVGGAETT